MFNTEYKFLYSILHLLTEIVYYIFYMFII